MALFGWDPITNSSEPPFFTWSKGRNTDLHGFPFTLTDCTNMLASERFVAVTV
jgi:hypothetical protein